MRAFNTLLALLLSTTSATAAPNIVVVLTDDQEDTGSIAYMPNTLSLIAQHGITFKNSFVNFSLCSPSRSSLLTGEAAHNDGITSNSAVQGGGYSSFEGDEDNTLPVWLKKAGYHTALLGKYINGYGKGKIPRQNREGGWTGVISYWLNMQVPQTQNPRTWVPPGWDLWYAFTKGEHYYDYMINENGTVLNFGHRAEDYSTDVLRARAVRFIKDQARTTAPFFMLIAPKAPHVQNEGKDNREPAVPSPAYANRFKDVKLPLTPAFNEEDVSDKPKLVKKAPKLDEVSIGETEKAYRAELQSLQSVDDLVGAVIEALDSAGKLDDTVVVYTSDNGFMYGDHRLRGKNVAYEGAIKVPLLIRGPGVPENEARSQLVNNLDVVATIESISGLTAGIVPDGHSLTPLFADAKSPWRSALFVEGGSDEGDLSRRFEAVRTLTRKYVKYVDGFEELYDLTADPYELHNKVHEASYANDLATLRRLRQTLESCKSTSCWVP